MSLQCDVISKCFMRDLKLTTALLSGMVFIKKER